MLVGTGALELRFLAWAFWHSAYDTQAALTAPPHVQAALNQGAPRFSGWLERLVKSPVLMVRGEYDGIATEEDLLDFFRRLPNPDRQFIVLAGASHAVALGLSRGQLWHVIRAFLTMPTA